MKQYVNSAEIKESSSDAMKQKQNDIFKERTKPHLSLLDSLLQLYKLIYRVNEMDKSIKIFTIIFLLLLTGFIGFFIHSSK